MKSSKHVFGKPYFVSLVCKGLKYFMKKNASFLPHWDFFCHVMNDHTPLLITCTVRLCPRRRRGAE